MRRSFLVLVLAVVAYAPAQADWNEAKAAFDNRDYTTALREFQAAVEAHANYKNNAGTHWYIGKCQQALGREREALMAFREANRLEPTHPQFALSYSTALINASQGREAADVLSKVKLDGLDGKQRGTLLTMRARGLVAAGDSRTAADVARQATQADGTSHGAWGTLGLALGNESRFMDAFAAFKRAWELSSDAAYARSAVANGISAARTTNVKAQKDEIYGRVAEVATQLAERRGGGEGALLAGEALMGAGDYDEALGWFGRSGLDNALINYYKGQCYVGKGDVRQAERFFRDALAKNPDAALRRNIYNSLGFALDKQGRYSDAAQAYREVGNDAKVAEMNEKAKRAEQNKQADEEQRRFEELQRLQDQYKELAGGGGGPAPTPTPKR